MDQEMYHLRINQDYPNAVFFTVCDASIINKLVDQFCFHSFCKEKSRYKVSDQYIVYCFQTNKKLVGGKTPTACTVFYSSWFIFKSHIYICYFLLQAMAMFITECIQTYFLKLISTVLWLFNELEQNGGFCVWPIVLCSSIRFRVCCKEQIQK